MQCSLHPGIKIDSIIAITQQASLSCSMCRRNENFITIDEFQENPLSIFNLSNFKNSPYGQIIATATLLQQQIDLGKAFFDMKKTIDEQLTSIFQQIQKAIEQFTDVQSKSYYIFNDLSKILSISEISQEMQIIEQLQDVAALKTLLQRLSSVCFDSSDSFEQLHSQFYSELKEVHHNLEQPMISLNQFFKQFLQNQSVYQSEVRKLSIKDQAFQRHIINQDIIPFQNSQLLSDKNRVYIQNLFNNTAQKVKLIYQSQIQSLTGEAFVKHCFDQGPTIMMFKLSSHEILGAYNPQSWQNRGVYPKNQTQKLTLFSVTKQEEFYLKAQCDQTLKCKQILGDIKFKVEISFGQDDINMVLPETNKPSSDPCFIFSYFPQAFKVPNHLKMLKSHMDNASNQYYQKQKYLNFRCVQIYQNIIYFLLQIIFPEIVNHFGINTFFISMNINIMMLKVLLFFIGSVHQKGIIKLSIGFYTYLLQLNNIKLEYRYEIYKYK